MSSRITLTHHNGPSTCNIISQILVRTWPHSSSVLTEFSLSSVENIHPPPPSLFLCFEITQISLEFYATTFNHPSFFISSFSGHIFPSCNGILSAVTWKAFFSRFLPKYVHHLKSCFSVSHFVSKLNTPVACICPVFFY